MTVDHTTNRIRGLNDELREHGIGGRVVATGGVAALPEQQRAAILARVRSFADFSADNDPHGEHDFGCFEVGDNRLMWKIDYYDTTLSGASPDPSNPAVTKRVLIVLLAEEY